MFLSSHCDIKPSTVHYRNKNEFHIKYDENGEVVVGLVIGKASLDSLHCIKSDKLLNTHPTHSSVARYLIQ